MSVSALTLPYIKGSAPVSVSGNTPVLNIFQPVAETSRTYIFRYPVDGVVISDKPVSYVGHFDEPGISCVIDKRRVASPAVRIFMLKLWCSKQLALCIKVFENMRVGIFYKHSPIRCFSCHIALCINKLYKRKVIVSAYPCVVLTESRSDMNYTRTVGHGYIVVAGHKMTLLALLFSAFTGAGEKRFIFCPFKILTHAAFKHFVSCLAFLCKTAKHRIKQRLSHDIGVSVRSFYLAVCVGGVNAKCYV